MIQNNSEFKSLTQNLMKLSPLDSRLTLACKQVEVACRYLFFYTLADEQPDGYTHRTTYLRLSQKWQVKRAANRNRNQ